MIIVNQTGQIVPSLRDQLLLSALRLIAGEHGDEFEIARQARGGQVGRADDETAAAAADLQKKLGVEYAAGLYAADRVELAGLLRQG